MAEILCPYPTPPRMDSNITVDKQTSPERDRMTGASLALATVDPVITLENPEDEKKRQRAMSRAIERREKARSTVLQPVAGSANFTQRRLA